MIIAIVIGLTGLYIFGSIYLLKRERPLVAYSTKERHLGSTERFPTSESIEHFEISIDHQALSRDERTEIFYALYNHMGALPDKTLDHGLWFLKNEPLHPLNIFEGSISVMYSIKTKEADQTELIQEIVAIWKDHIEKHPGNVFYLKAAAQYSRHLDQAFSVACWKKALEISPFCATALEALASMTDTVTSKRTYNHPLPELQEALLVFKKRLSYPWPSSASDRLEQLREKYPFFPNWACFGILYIYGLIHPQSRPWNDYYFISDLGMTAYQCGEYDLARKCSEQFLKLQPAAEKNHDHPPLFAKGFSLAAILALKDQNIDLLDKFLEKKAEDPAESEFDFMQDEDILIELIRGGRRDLAIGFMEKRARKNGEISPAVQTEIDYVKNGGNIFSKEYFNRHRS